MYTGMEIRQNCAWIDTGYYGILCRVTGKCCFNFIRKLESKRKGIHWLRELCKQRQYFPLGKASTRSVLCHVVSCGAAKAAANLRFWCRQSQLCFRTMKSTSSAVYLPTAKSPSSIFSGQQVDGQMFVPLYSTRNPLTNPLAKILWVISLS